MGDRAKGLYQKFHVERRDGKSAPGAKHHGCEYFVLDMTHDLFAIPAVLAYVEACKREYPLLAKDLLAKLPKWAALSRAKGEEEG